MKTWQDGDEEFYNWLDEYLINNNLPSFEESGDYGHIDIVELRSQFCKEQE